MKLLEFILAASALAIMPGPDILFVITQSLNVGWRRTIYIILGLMTGLVIYTALISLGVGQIVSNYPAALDIMKYLGAAYLLWLGVNGIIKSRTKNSETEQKSVEIKEKRLDLYFRGVIMNLVNPKVMIFFLALFTPFLSGNEQQAQNEMIILGAIMIVITFIIFNIAAFLGSKIKSLFTQKNMSKIPYISFVVYLLIIAMIIFSR